MKPEVATRRIEAFKKRFGEAHLYFAYHAAFPLALTPDLLYRLWANFQTDIHGENLHIPWLAVADFLLSSLCEEVSFELYELDTTVRNQLLTGLKENQRFGEKRIHELSDFLLAYIKEQLNSHDPDIRDFAQAQRWTALAYTKPSEAARELASVLAGLKFEEKAEWIRMASVIETFAEPLAGFEPLLIYVRGIANFVRGKHENLVTEITSLLADNETHLQITGVNLALPEKIANSLVKSVSNSPYNNNSISSRSSTHPKILVVDDSSDNLFLIKTILEEEGYTVSTYENGISALAELEKSSYDLVLLDLIMPEMDGYEIIKCIRNEMNLQQYIPIILITAHDDVNVAKGLDLGADDFIRKPITVDELLARVRSRLRLKQLIDEQKKRISWSFSDKFA